MTTVAYVLWYALADEVFSVFGKIKARKAIHPYFGEKGKRKKEFPDVAICDNKVKECFSPPYIEATMY